uniref:Uncharacterized protein n=1 Tax=Anguilla anguilla TaxID=7936 RepID=A0A0E9SIV6_ANGAN
MTLRKKGQKGYKMRTRFLENGFGFNSLKKDSENPL